MVMKLDRLLAITMVLINQRRVQAQELADMFEVSVRTIYRDIETLNQAGIPIVTYQGQNGGIGLIDGFRMDKNVLTRDELSAISTALKSISTSYQDEHASTILEKIKGLSDSQQPPETFFVDFSPWGGNTLLKGKITSLKRAIEGSLCIQFFYSNNLGEKSYRDVEPHTIVLKGQSWYLYGFCLHRREFRLFKIPRMKDLVISDKTFNRKEVQVDQSPWDKAWYNPKNVTLLTITFQAKHQSIMEEMFGIENVIKDENGRLLVHTEMPEDEGMYSFLLSFSDRIEVLEPLHVRKKLKELLKNMIDKYLDDNY
ncbi:YafY family protein [Heyndrickxia sp. FSL W8-0496]|uniref:helix-turn-helix transcriptional regulator n=1 Tax=Heyndrickxia sp. FSL W8-0496 TaxID=2954702 RepID=UPI0030F9B4A8